MFVEYAWLIPLLPVFSFLICLFLGKKLSEGGGYIAVGAIFGSFIISILVVYEVVFLGVEHHPYESSRIWIDFGHNFITGEGNLVIEAGYLVDNLSALMLVLVSILCLLIGIYSIGYMGHDDCKDRYYAEFSLFVVGMLGMVMANNYVIFLIFWEVMGVVALTHAATTIPISINAYGFRELTVVAVVQVLDVPIEQAAALAIVTRGLALIASLPGALWIGGLLDDWRRSPQGDSLG